MAFDGIVVANLVKELKEAVLNGRLSKIAQPEADELLITIKGNKGQYRLQMSASASLPFIYLTNQNKQSPLTAPNFCMLLRKHIANGRIINISQPGLERIIEFEIEHLDELGDLGKKKLIIELMGKHSNIIFCKEDGTIIDSIKHVSAQVSSIREVLPGRTYFIPHGEEKKNPLTTDKDSFYASIYSTPNTVRTALLSSFTGFSPIATTELCYRSGIDADSSTAALTEEEQLHLYHHFSWFIEEIKEGKFSPRIIFRKDEPIEFLPFEFSIYKSLAQETYDSIFQVLENYYAKKSSYTRIRQKSFDLRRIVTTALERNRKKLALQEKQIADTEKKDKFRIYGELLNTYGYDAKEGDKQLEAFNYYTNESISIPLDVRLTASENAKKYFEKYNKLKRTYEALSTFVEETKEEILHLESIATALDIALSEDDLVQIREELVEYGYIKKKRTDKKQKTKSKPFHYLSSDGYHMYVGKNNFQNEELTFKFATGNDWWFHAKGMPGSHVVVKCNNEELPDSTFEEAGRLAGFYSKGRGAEKIEIDYLQKKNVKKPNKGAPGFVVYYTNYSLTISPDISSITCISQ